MGTVVDLSDRYCCLGGECRPRPSTFSLTSGNLWRCPNCRKIWRFREEPSRTTPGKVLVSWEPASMAARLAVLLRLRSVDLGAK